ncbi:MAG: PHP domain-containing protein [Bacillota bacterium]
MTDKSLENLKHLVRADLHVHSCLSPCANNNMVPLKVLQACYERQVNMVAITDHNSVGNAASFIEAARIFKEGAIKVIPGLEVQSREEVHVICLFSEMDMAKKCQEVVDQYLPNTKCKSELFGDQLLVDPEGYVVGSEERLLLNSLDLSVDQIVEIVCSLEGLAIAAHVDRPYYSLHALLGFVPQDLHLAAVEISARANPAECVQKMNLGQFAVISSSDAHYLKDVGKVCTCFTGEPCFASLKQALKGKEVRIE